VSDYDPDGDGEESPEATRNAIDGNRTTNWDTETYRGGSFTGIKKGVGLYMDAGKPILARRVDLVTATPGFEAEVYGSDTVPGGIEDPEVGQSPGPILQRLLDRPAVRHNAIMLGSQVVDLQDQLDARRWVTCRPIDRVLPIGGADPHRIPLQRDITDWGGPLVANEGEAEDPRIERDESVEVRGEDLEAHRHSHGSSLARRTSRRTGATAVRTNCASDVRVTVRGHGAVAKRQ
jgi:hypothetical protein